eukprot:14726567-Alexandrium_andersonii.AAC.1
MGAAPVQWAVSHFCLCSVASEFWATGTSAVGTPFWLRQAIRARSPPKNEGRATEGSVPALRALAAHTCKPCLDALRTFS